MLVFEQREFSGTYTHTEKEKGKETPEYATLLKVLIWSKSYTAETAHTTPALSHAHTGNEVTCLSTHEGHGEGGKIQTSMFPNQTRKQASTAISCYGRSLLGRCKTSVC